jgi:AbiV family abortive infection protein
MEDESSEFWNKLLNGGADWDTRYPSPADRIRVYADLLEKPGSLKQKLFYLKDKMLKYSEGIDVSEIERNVLHELKTKDQIKRDGKFLDLMNRMISDGKPLGICDSAEEDWENFLKLQTHIESLWHDSVTLFDKLSFSTAAFVSIACLEELGKLAVANHQLIRNELIRRGIKKKCARGQQSRKSPFYNHHEKQSLAAIAGTLVNRRLDNLLSMEKVDEFIQSAEKGKLEVIRQTALYSELLGNQISIPTERITEEIADFYISLCGEILIKVTKGYNTNDNRRIECMVKRFRLRLIEEE